MRKIQQHGRLANKSCGEDVSEDLPTRYFFFFQDFLSAASQRPSGTPALPRMRLDTSTVLDGHARSQVRLVSPGDERRPRARPQANNQHATAPSLCANPTKISTDPPPSLSLPPSPNLIGSRQVPKTEETMSFTSPVGHACCSLGAGGGGNARYAWPGSSPHGWVRVQPPPFPLLAPGHNVRTRRA